MGRARSKHKKTCRRSNASGRLAGADAVVHACCGSKSNRHKKDYLASENLSSPHRHKVDGRPPFSQGTYYSVKNALDDGETVDAIVAGKGLDLLEVRRVGLADSFEDYLEIA